MPATRSIERQAWKRDGHPSGERLATVGGLLAILLWSATFALARSVSEQVGSLTAGAATYLVGGAVLLLRLCQTPKPFGRFGAMPWRYVWGCGFLFVLYAVLVYLAVGLAKDRAQLLELALVNYLWPAATVLLSILLLRHRANWLLAPGTLCALAGVFLVMTQGTRVSWQSFHDHFWINPLAYFMMLMAAIAWGLYSTLTRRWSKPDGGGAVELFVPATGLVLLTMRCVTPESTAWNLRAGIEIIASGTITALAYALWDWSMRKGNLQLVVACSYLTPFLSTLVSSAYLGVLPGVQLWSGCGLIVLGSFISWRSLSDRSDQG